MWQVHFCDSLSKLKAQENMENLLNPSAQKGEMGLNELLEEKSLNCFAICV